MPVTCVRYGELEIMSGDNLGRIFMWWMATGNKPPYIIHKINVHTGPVRCMQVNERLLSSSHFIVFSSPLTF